ncbi:MAG TPA: cytochrome o ubiquinol oxidase subunit IV [Methylocystis sp.]|nr:cytochrome o ubiquinol oxidase subunit IV [Methylocystis sp.]
MTASDENGAALDVAPGEVDAEGADVWEGVQTYLIGLVLSGLLTAAAFYMVQWQWLWAPSIPVALTVLAIAQIGVHLVFFLHLTTAADNVNNSLALAFGTLIVALVIGGTLWIMYHMNQNMPQMAQMSASGPPHQTARGVIDAAAAPVGAKISGRVLSVECDIGMRVEKGRLCATIDAPTLQRAASQSESGLRAAQLRVEQDRAALAGAAGAKKRAEALQRRLELDSGRVAELARALDAAKAKLADASIRAPIDGVVLARNVERGQIVSPGPQPLFVLAPEAVEIKASVPVSMAEVLTEGQKLAFTVDQLQGRRFDGEIVRVTPGQGAKAAEVVLTAPNPDGALKPGMAATIEMR